MAIGKRFNAFMSKRSGLREFEAALEVANLGGFYLDPICMKVLWSDRADVSNSSSVSSCLSDRERSVLVLVARGHTAKEIAIQLDVSCKTVETYRSRAMRKLSLVGRAEIVDFVAQNRLTA
ncbi:MAG: LuxR C-terminal-related transcriptional regulator [Pseudomonadota bacterium]